MGALPGSSGPWMASQPALYHTLFLGELIVNASFPGLGLPSKQSHNINKGVRITRDDQ